jgi:signal transduction histidine kinase
MSPPHRTGARQHAGRAPSNGIGLTICRAIVEAHGGTLAIDSDRAIGTTVSFTIPPRARTDDG